MKKIEENGVLRFGSYQKEHIWTNKMLVNQKKYKYLGA
jgi:hypothetical protein